MDKISNAAIVSSYNQVIQAVMTDLKREPGIKAKREMGGTGIAVDQ